MTAKNIANFIGKNAYTANKIIMTDLCRGLICESMYGRFIMTCPDQNLYREISTHLAPIQQESAEPKNFPMAAKEKMEKLWDAEEEAVM
jgi:hypothetical protein